MIVLYRRNNIFEYFYWRQKIIEYLEEINKEIDALDAEIETKMNNGGITSDIFITSSILCTKIGFRDFLASLLVNIL